MFSFVSVGEIAEQHLTSLVLLRTQHTLHVASTPPQINNSSNGTHAHDPTWLSVFVPLQVTLRYFRGERYLEVDVDLASTPAASQASKAQAWYPLVVMK